MRRIAPNLRRICAELRGVALGSVAVDDGARLVVDGEDEGDGGSHGSPEALDDTDEVLSSDAGGALFSESGYSSAGGPFGYASAGAYNAATDTDGDVGD